MNAHERAVVEALSDAYRAGAFPMADPDTDELAFFDPDPRAIMPLTEREGLRVPRRLARTIRAGRFRVTSDRAFGQVVRACARPRRVTPRSEAVSRETWIDDRIVGLYELMHRAGRAHSVEAWREDPSAGSDPLLVGGIYGVHLGGLFAGESMFHDAARGGTDAGKVCLVELVRHLHACGFSLFDVQFSNPLLARFGCVEIPRQAYKARLREALARRVAWRRMDNSDDG